MTSVFLKLRGNLECVMETIERPLDGSILF